MNEFFESVKKWCRHNQGMMIAFVLMVIFVIWFFGCQSTVDSMIHPNRKITEPELRVEYSAEMRRLEAEITHLEEITDIRLQDIYRQDAMKQALYRNALIIAETGTVNPLGILSLLGTVFGIGAVIDNRRKDGLIKGLKKPPE